jgi:hypothetical protein
MVNPYLDKSIAVTKKLQVIITRMVEFEKDLGDQVNDSDYPAEMISTAFNEENDPYTEETQLLAMVNDLLYRLMDYQRESDQWHDEEDVEQKSVLKLKEIVVENACSF